MFIIMGNELSCIICLVLELFDDDILVGPQNPKLGCVPPLREF